MTWTLFAIILYVLAQLVVAFWVSRKITNEEDYIVAGRSLGPTLAIFTIFATWFGAETCIGAAGASYDGGIKENTADPFGYGLCVLLMGAFFAARIWKLKLTTLGDLFRRRFGAAAEKLSVVLLIPGSILWAAAQIKAFGEVLSHASSWDSQITTTCAAAVVIIYTAFGGLKADAVTDFIQGLVLVIGVVTLFVVVYFFTDGFDVSEIPEEKLTFKGATSSWGEFFEGWAIPLCGSVFAAELVARIVATRSASVARGAALTAGTIYVSIGVLVVALGLAGTVLIPDLESGEQILMALAKSKLAIPLYIIFAGALISAILSTVDSALLVAGSLLAHNVLIQAFKIDKDSTRLKCNRFAVVVFGFIAYGLAFSSDSVYGLVEEASAFGTAGVFFCVIIGLFFKAGGKWTALLAMSFGAGSYIGAIYLNYLIGISLNSIVGITLGFIAIPHPYLLSLLFAATGITVGLILDSKPNVLTGDDGQ